MKRFLKIVAVILAIVISVPVLVVLGVVVKYQSIVRTAPGLDAPIKPAGLTAKVDLYIASGGWPWMGGLNTPAAQVPFGMVKLGPDTESFIFSQRNLNRSGYYYGDDRLVGFSHSRLCGADAKEGGVFRVLPAVASRVAELRGKRRYLRFSHEDETASPGYYALRLEEGEILAELTATARAGFHRYTFLSAESAHIIMNVASTLGGQSSDTAFSVDPAANALTGKTTIRGSFSGRYGGLTVYFAARFSQPFTGYKLWLDNRQSDEEPPPAETAVAVVHYERNAPIEFAFTPVPGQPIELRIGVSYVSIDNARENLDAELGGRTFESIVAAAQEAWEERLSTIKVSGGTEEQQRIFYTALYRTMQMPTIFNDVNGQYRGFNHEGNLFPGHANLPIGDATHTAEGFTYYTDFSLWDTFRAVHPLYNLIARAEHRDMMMSLVEMAKQGGCLPRWPAGAGYTNCMFGTPADCAVSEAWLKGIRDFDIDTAYAKMRQTALEGKPPWTRFAGREGLEHHLQYHYLPYDLASDSVAATLEYAWSDAALAGLATALGKADDAAIFADHAKWYQNLWNPATQHFEPRDAHGNFSAVIKHTKLTYIDPDRKYTEGYVEGSAEQWRFAVPHDPEGLAALWPTREEFHAALEAHLEGSTPGVGEWNPGGHYWHGNEPYIHAAYLFAATGRPDLTQKWVRWIMAHKYDDTYYGLDGNDDGGTLSAWYVFSALGFYPIAGTTRYYLGSPLFDRAEIDMGEATLVITAENNSAENLYVESVSLNGQPLGSPWFSHEQIAAGGELMFRMRANKDQ